MSDRNLRLLHPDDAHAMAEGAMRERGIEDYRDCSFAGTTDFVWRDRGVEFSLRWGAGGDRTWLGRVIIDADQFSEFDTAEVSGGTAGECLDAMERECHEAIALLARRVAAAARVLDRERISALLASESETRRGAAQELIGWLRLE